MADPTEDTTELAVEREADLAAPADAVWDAITDPGLLAEWFGPLEFDVRPGGAITTSEVGEDGEAVEPGTIGVVETVEPPRRIGFVWIEPGSESPTSVEIVIDDSDDGGSIVRTREVRLTTDFDRRPAWFSPSARACVSARA